MNGKNYGLLGRIEGVSGGQVCLAGTGIIVTFVVDLFVAGESAENIAREYGVKEQAIQAALRLVLEATYTSRGLPVAVERKMEARIPLVKR